MHIFEAYKKYGPITTLRYTSNYIYRYLRYRILLGSYSQDGEDLVVNTILRGKDRNDLGFYVDIGAYDPTYLSNTKYFHSKGWSGINIDPNSRSIERFRRHRPKDINLNFGVSTKSTILQYFEFDSEMLNTFSPEQAKIYLELGHKMTGSKKISVYPLEHILDTHLPSSKVIDVLFIDTEGHDIEVLRSNNWEKYKPRCICIEMETEDFGSDNAPITNFLKEKGYSRVWSGRVNAVFTIDSKG